MVSTAWSVEGSRYGNSISHIDERPRYCELPKFNKTNLKLNLVWNPDVNPQSSYTNKPFASLG